MFSYLWMLLVDAKDSCLPGSSLCKDNAMYMCDIYGNFVVVDCPDKTICGLKDGTLMCIREDEENKRNGKGKKRNGKGKKNGKENEKENGNENGKEKEKKNGKDLKNGHEKNGHEKKKHEKSKEFNKKKHRNNVGRKKHPKEEVEEDEESEENSENIPEEDEDSQESGGDDFITITKTVKPISTKESRKEVQHTVTVYKTIKERVTPSEIKFELSKSQGGMQLNKEIPPSVHSPGHMPIRYGLGHAGGGLNNYSQGLGPKHTSPMTQNGGGNQNGSYNKPQTGGGTSSSSTPSTNGGSKPTSSGGGSANSSTSGTNSTSGNSSTSGNGGGSGTKPTSNTGSANKPANGGSNASPANKPAGGGNASPANKPTGGGNAPPPSPNKPANGGSASSSPNKPDNASSSENKPGSPPAVNKPDGAPPANKPESGGNAPPPSNGGTTQPESSKPTENGNASQSNSKPQTNDTQGGGGKANLTTEELSSAITASGFTPPPDSDLSIISDAINNSMESKEEAAMFIAQCIHESQGFIEKIETKCKESPDSCAGEYSSPLGVEGKQYYGRGYIQLSWPENYKAAGEALGMGDELLNNPDQVGDNPEMAIKTAIWYWETNVRTAEGVSNNQFGSTTKAINGPLECSGGGGELPAKRFEIYLKVAEALKIENKASEAGC